MAEIIACFINNFTIQYKKREKIMTKVEISKQKRKCNLKI